MFEGRGFICFIDAVLQSCCTINCFKLPKHKLPDPLKIDPIIIKRVIHELLKTDQYFRTYYFELLRTCKIMGFFLFFVFLNFLNFDQVTETSGTPQFVAVYGVTY